MTCFKLLFALILAGLSATQSELLRGTPDLDSQRLSKQDLQIIKRVNDERKNENKKKKDQQELKLEKEAWIQLTKEEKKDLLEKLKQEESELKQKEENKGQSDKKGKKDGESSSLIQQYTTLLNTDIKTNTVNSIWKSLSKPEKKELLALQKGKLIIHNGKVVDNPDYIVDKLSKVEKKEQAKLEKEQNSATVEDSAKDDPSDVDTKPKPKPDKGKEEEDTMKPNAASNTFVSNKPVIESQANPEQESSTSSTTTTPPKDMKPNSEPVDKAEDNNGFVIPMPQTLLNQNVQTTTTTTTTSTTYKTGNSDTCNDCYEFATELEDPSVPFDGSELKWTMDGLPWSTYTEDCYNSDSCVVSGITGTYALNDGAPVYSNLTLTTKQDFDGGVLTFYLKHKGLQYPNEAFFVSVDGEIASSKISEGGDWIEYGVVVGNGKRRVTWSHVYNPLGLESLPERKIEQLKVDDLRFSPFLKVGQGIEQGFERSDDNGLIMTTDGDAAWQKDDTAAHSGSYSIVAKTKNIKANSGSSDVHFELYSHFGGTLKYKIITSTTAPYDDFAILFNGRPIDAVFGLTRTLPNFEYRELAIPPGKIKVTMQHRKNPGKLNRSVLDSLGDIQTTGMTRLDNVKFIPN